VLFFYFRGYESLLFIPIAVVCYTSALATSHFFVRWILPQRLGAELGNGARYVAIDGIRGYLALGVYVQHCLVTGIFLRDGRWGEPSSNFGGQFANACVAIFFMITAFLFWSRACSKGKMEWKAFFISRLFRIYPLYLFVVVTICLAVAYKSDWVALEPATSIATEIVKWLFFRAPDINHYPGTALIVAGVTWTLRFEAWFYLSLPLLVGVFLKKQAMWKKLAALAIVAALFKLNYLSVSITVAFLGGIIAVYWRADAKRIKLAESNAAALLALACLGCVLFFLFDPFNVVGIALLSIFFVVIASGNTLFGLLKMRAALWLGEVSYSIYLCHGLILWVIVQNLLPRLVVFHPTTMWLAASAIGITPIIILFSSGSYLLIERPLINMGHRISRRNLSGRG
jgi:peptidoglycan/LPS O-acetylase OafA/YrhL